MELFNTGVWDMLLDLAALTLCAITVLYILGKKRSLSTGRIQDASDERIRSIVEKTFDQFIRVDTGRSFNGMFERVNRESLVHPPRGIDTVPTGDRVNAPVKASKKAANARPAVSEAVRQIRANGVDNKTMRIFQFTASGMSVKKISDKLAIPRCEVELIAKFQQRENGRTAVL